MVFSFSFDRVITGTYNFMSAIWNADPVGAVITGIILTKTQFLDQVKINSNWSISQLINDILRVLQKMLKCFNGTVISV